MKKLEQECWEVVTNSDLTEGRGMRVSIGYFTNKWDAEKAARGRGVMGSNAYVHQINLCVKVYDTFLEYQKEVKTEQVLKILNKLTLEEQELLGLIDKNNEYDLPY